MRSGRIRGALAAGTLMALAGHTHAQTLSNPDLGVIGDMRAIARSSETADSTGSRPLSFEFEELEISVGAHLNPYMRADVFLAIHGTDGIEVEEANLTVLHGLPLSLQANAGVFLLDFGRLNAQHPHQWAWLERPLAARTMLGDEGLRATGLRATSLASVGETAVTLSASAFSGDAFDAHEAGEPHEDEDEGTEAAPRIMGAGRVSLFRQVSDTWSAETGGSYLGGEYDATESLSLGIVALDAKLRWRPDAYRAFVWVFEAMSGSRDVAFEDSTGHMLSTVDATGMFTSAEFQWRKRWSGGGFFDWTEDAVIEGAQTTAAGAFLAFSPAEETARFSLVYRHETSDLYAFTNDTLTLQFLWSLGPHRIHTF